MSTGGGDSKKRLFARPTALLVDAVPTRITMPVPPPITMRLPEPEARVVATEEEPLAGPARLFIGAPRAVAPLKVRAGLDRRTEHPENETDDPSAGPAVPFPLKSTPFDREPPPLPNRWGIGVAKVDEPVPARTPTPPPVIEPIDWLAREVPPEPAPASVKVGVKSGISSRSSSTNRAEEQAREQRESAERAWAESRANEKRGQTEPPIEAVEQSHTSYLEQEADERAERARAERAWMEERAQAERERAAEQERRKQANAEKAREEQTKLDLAKAEKARADLAKLEQAKAEKARADQAREQAAREEQAKSERAKAETPAAARVDRPLQPMVVGPAKQGQKPYLPNKQTAPKKKALHPGIWAGLGVLFLAVGVLGTWWEIRDSVLTETPLETPVPEPIVVHSPVPETVPPVAPIEAIATQPDVVVAEPEIVQPPPEVVPPPVVPVAETPPTAEKPNSNPMEKTPLAERPVVIAERPTPPETTAKASTKVDAPPQIRPGVLRVTSTTPAKVYVDGKAFGQVEKDVMIELAPGVHDVKLVAKKGGRSQTQRVRVDSGGAIMLSYEFK